MNKVKQSEKDQSVEHLLTDNYDNWQISAI